jgi:hypothetical protein
MILESESGRTHGADLICDQLDKQHCPVCLAPWLLFPEQFMSYNHLIRLHGEHYAVPYCALHDIAVSSCVNAVDEALHVLEGAGA